MIDVSRRNPPAHQTLHALPGNATLLAAPRETALPKPRHLSLESSQRFHIVWNAIVAIVAQQNRAQPRTLLGDILAPTSPQFTFDVGKRIGPPKALFLPRAATA
jgi:hypothetical protein